MIKHTLAINSPGLVGFSETDYALAMSRERDYNVTNIVKTGNKSITSHIHVDQF